jgi:hypothetical protein
MKYKDVERRLCNTPTKRVANEPPNKLLLPTYDQSRSHSFQQTANRLFLGEVDSQFRNFPPPDCCRKGEPPSNYYYFLRKISPAPSPQFSPQAKKATKQPVAVALFLYHISTTFPPPTVPRSLHETFRYFLQTTCSP